MDAFVKAYSMTISTTDIVNIKSAEENEKFAIAI